MVRSDSADEDMNIVVDDRYDLMEEEDFAAQANGWHAVEQPKAVNRSMSASLSPLSSSALDPDRRLRRQIANCNERRRMQSINAGFQSLRALLPRKEGEKLSKAAILQQTADLIHQMLAERGDEPIVSKKARIEEERESIEAEQRATIFRLQAQLERERTTRAHIEQQLASVREAYQRQQLQLQSTATVTVSAPPTPATPSMIASTPMPTTPLALNVQHSPMQETPEHKPSMLSYPAVSLAAMSLAGPATPVTLSPPAMLPRATPHEASVIRPTPLAPISVDVSTPSLSSPLTLTSSLNVILPQHGLGLLASNALASNGLQPSAFTSTSSTSHPSLQTILAAIRHLEGGGSLLAQSPPTSQAPLVR